MNLFELATRKRLMFTTSKGVIDISDLWTLPLTSAKGVSLNSVAIDLDRKMSEQGEKSFVKSEAVNPAYEELSLKLDVVKRIIEVREAEAAESARRLSMAKERDTLLEALALKKKESILSLSEEEIMDRLSKM